MGLHKLVKWIHRIKVSLRHIGSSPKYTSTDAASLVYKEHGDPRQVLTLTLGTVENPEAVRNSDQDVLVKMLAAPVNPSDINMIQGVYPIKPKIPAIGGNEGVGEVIAVGQNVTSLREGDWVIPNYSGWGTWRTLAMTSEKSLFRVPNDLPVASIATMSVNPCTAYRLLHDFENLHPGDVIIQNGANSAVGQAVIQIAAELGLVTVNIVRNRPDLDKLVQKLEDLGANHVISDEMMRTQAMKDLVTKIGRPKLALNCVGGKASAELLKWLEKKSNMVTYGGMSKQPLMVPAGPLIFNDVKVLGYWMTRWTEEHNDSPERQEMWEFLSNMVRNGKLNPPLHRLTPIEEYKDAIAAAMEPFTTEKQILFMQEL